MKQKIVLREGVASFEPMKPFHPSTGARNTPSVKLSRLRELIKTSRPQICVVRGEGIGDVLCTTPTVHALKRQFKEVDITYATNTSYLGGSLVKVLKYNPDISSIIDRALLDDSQFDLVVNLHCPAIRLERGGATPPSRIDIFAQHAGVSLRDPVPRYYPKATEIEAGEVRLKTVMPNEPTVLVQVSASNPRRSWPQRSMKKALQLLAEKGVRSIVLTHDERFDVIWDNIPGALVLNRLDIREIAGVMVHCDLVLCMDSSILHLGGALQMPMVGIFGPTPPKSRIGHYEHCTAIWHGNKAACPCWYGGCPIGYACWAETTPQEVAAECLSRLQNSEKVNILQLLERESTVEIATEIV